ncbi:MAG: penicillin-binding protein 2, partial [Martelella sp.]
MIKLPGILKLKPRLKPKARRVAKAQPEAAESNVFQGTAKKRVNLARSRVGFVTFAFVAVYAVIGGRLVHYSLAKDDGAVARAAMPLTLARRP